MIITKTFCIRKIIFIFRANHTISVLNFYRAMTFRASSLFIQIISIITFITNRRYISKTVIIAIRTKRNHTMLTSSIFIYFIFVTDTLLAFIIFFIGNIGCYNWSICNFCIRLISAFRAKIIAY